MLIHLNVRALHIEQVVDDLMIEAFLLKYLELMLDQAIGNKYIKSLFFKFCFNLTLIQIVYFGKWVVE